MKALIQYVPPDGVDEVTDDAVGRRLARAAARQDQQLWKGDTWQWQTVSISDVKEAGGHGMVEDGGS